MRENFADTLEGVGQALRKSFPIADRDKEEQAERHELRKLDIKEALGK